MPSRPLRSLGLSLAAVVVLGRGPLFAGELTLAIRDGRVTLVAENVTVRQILDEWARVGRTRIINADTLTGPPISLRLVEVPEAQALETVLRSASGFVAAPRQVAEAGASRFDRIVILASSRPPASAPAATPTYPTPASSPLLQRPPRPGGLPRPGAVDDQDQPTEDSRPAPLEPGGRPVSPFVPGQPPGPPGEPPPFPPIDPDDAPTPFSPMPQAPQSLTVPRPGMVVAPPTPPTGTPAPPGSTAPPPDPRRPPQPPRER